MRHEVRSWLLAGVALAAVGCGDPLKEVVTIQEMRVLGARVEVEGEPGRASPLPGENASVSFFVVNPATDPEAPVGWQLAVCGAAPEGSALPACAEEPFATASADEPATGAPRIDFTVPADTTSTTLAVLGAICPDAGGASCDGDAGTAVSFDFDLALPEATVNTNPNLDAASITFDGVVWGEGTDCATLPEVSARSAHTIELWLAESDRDPLPAETSVDPQREILQVSHFSDRGLLDHAFTVIASDSSELVSRVSWEAPGIPADAVVGLVARFYFVVRDDRGGTDWVERAACIAPPR